MDRSQRSPLMATGSARTPSKSQKGCSKVTGAVYVAITVRSGGAWGDLWPVRRLRADTAPMRPESSQTVPVAGEATPHLRRVAGPLFRLDPGWLFLVSGAAILSATVLIPAADDLARAKHERDRARAAERWHAKRLENYSAYLDALQRRDPTLVLSLASTQLNLAPVDKQAMLDASDLSLPPADVFAGLDPSFTGAAALPRPRSLLQRWTTDDRTRPWLIAGGALSVLVGLMPATRRR